MSHVSGDVALPILGKLHSTTTCMDLLVITGMVSTSLLGLRSSPDRLPERLFNKSIATSTVPKQWKLASISLHQQWPNFAAPQEHADYRPICITPALNKALDRVIVREIIRPVFLKPPAQLSFTDQYAFRPTGSTTAALSSPFSSLSRKCCRATRM